MMLAGLQPSGLDSPASSAGHLLPASVVQRALLGTLGLLTTWPWFGVEARRSRPAVIWHCPAVGQPAQQVPAGDRGGAG